jgi:hypothetical protein
MQGDFLGTSMSEFGGMVVPVMSLAVQDWRWSWAALGWYQQQSPGFEEAVTRITGAYQYEKGSTNNFDAERLC